MTANKIVVLGVLALSVGFGLPAFAQDTGDVQPPAVEAGADLMSSDLRDEMEQIRRERSQINREKMVLIEREMRLQTHEEALGKKIEAMRKTRTETETTAPTLAR